MQWSKRPYGSWSKCVIAFSVDEGLGKFMHLPDRSPIWPGCTGPIRFRNMLV
jgi:hypothetical protein